MSLERKRGRIFQDKKVNKSGKHKKITIIYEYEFMKHELIERCERRNL